MRFCWHKWAQWKDIASGFMTMEYDVATLRKLSKDEKYIKGTFITQERRCEKCGQVQLRREST